MTLLYRKIAYHQKLLSKRFTKTCHIHMEVLFAFLVTATYFITTTVLLHVTYISKNVTLYFLQSLLCTLRFLCVFGYFVMCIFIEILCNFTHPLLCHVFMTTWFSMSQCYVVIAFSCSFISCPSVNITDQHTFFFT